MARKTNQSGIPYVAFVTFVQTDPGLRNAQMIRCWTAFEGAIKDKVPIVGQSAKVPGLFHVCGFSAHGFQLAPMMGRVMSQLVLGQQPEQSLHAFRPDRFENEA